MLNQAIIDAIKDGKEVEFYCLASKAYVLLYGNNYTRGNYTFSYLMNAQWRIKPKPYEAKHIFYVNSTPKPEIDVSFFHELLLGAGNPWSTKSDPMARKKIEITVREVLDENNNT